MIIRDRIAAAYQPARDVQLAHRLRCAHEILGGGQAGPGDDGHQDAIILLDTCARAVQSNLSLDRVWLLCATVFGFYPTPEDVTATRRYLELCPPDAASSWLLERAKVAREELARQRQRAAERRLLDQQTLLVAGWRSAGLKARARTTAVYLIIRVPGLRRVARLTWRVAGVARLRAASALSGPARIHIPVPATKARAAGARGGGVGVVSGGVVVDVHHAARHDLHTGIQQVVRRTLPRWEQDHPVVPVAWNDDRSAWRTLTAPERQRLLRRGPRGQDQDHPLEEAPPPALVVPWRSVVVLAETPPLEACSRLAALAQYSGNRVVAVGYDCIPVVSADLVPAYEPQRFCGYLSVLKHARRISAISGSATAEFAGFASALPAQGLPGPAVQECTLPAGPAPHDRRPPDPARPPLVLCVGSLEPRKNHLALLYAAERLWREGLDFQLLLIAGSGWGEDIPAHIRRLQQAGRPLTIRTSPSDTELADAYQAARFSVLVSLHEGYGLPVAESLGWGTPVITTNYGSTAQITAGGGALLIDPRDDEALVTAMRRLLGDDDLLDTLRRQAHARSPRTWEHYATELWDQLVAPELQPLTTHPHP